MSNTYSRLLLAEVRMELLLVAHMLEGNDMNELLEHIMKTVNKIDEMDKDIQKC
ncbi:hypothetical protein MM326_18620 [Alkalihalobacillus sp. LMS6]|uniref:hypothetical protein n=1 Tax=Alkalihalobacillus sp. LMS6 TaxID=2924034 RepID=UPI0020D0644A|nr:hypothetical protein [Alkalihalobacillus sp. LMS6]UTR06068.1 hypothetical protein MM326_18620 [Alkalihalobacillus sp. LMS6]